MAAEAPQDAAAAGADSSSALRELRVLFSIDLHPSRTLQLLEAVRDELNSRLMRCVVPRERARNAPLSSTLQI